MFAMREFAVISDPERTLFLCFGPTTLATAPAPFGTCEVREIRECTVLLMRDISGVNPTDRRESRSQLVSRSFGMG
ncbi:MAG: hypothetical protein Tsb0019_38540 [Roseibium sp.]